MIVRPNGSSQILITQPDHAKLAEHIMEAWRADGFADAPARAAILLAVREHDNGWREVDTAPILDLTSGRILDFVTSPDAVRQEIWPRGVERLAATPYAAALVAQHALHVYARYRNDPPWQPWFAEVEGARDRHLRAAAPLTAADLTRDYFFVRMGDLLSLTFCSGWTTVQNDPNGYAVRLDGARLIVMPDPFEWAEVTLEITGRALPQRPFASASELHTVFSSAPAVPVAGVALGGRVS